MVDGLVHQPCSIDGCVGVQNWRFARVKRQFDTPLNRQKKLVDLLVSLRFTVLKARNCYSSCPYGLLLPVALKANILMTNFWVYDQHCCPLFLSREQAYHGWLLLSCACASESCFLYNTFINPHIFLSQWHYAVGRAYNIYSSIAVFRSTVIVAVAQYLGIGTFHAALSHVLSQLAAWSNKTCLA